MTRRQCNSKGGTVVKVINNGGSSSSSSSSSTASTDLSRYSGQYMIKNNICIGSCAALLPLRLKISGGEVKGEFKILNNSHDWMIHYQVSKTNSFLDYQIYQIAFNTDLQLKTKYLLSQSVFAKLFSSLPSLFLPARNQHPSKRPCYSEVCCGSARHFRL